MKTLGESTPEFKAVPGVSRSIGDQRRQSPLELRAKSDQPTGADDRASPAAAVHAAVNPTSAAGRALATRQAQSPADRALSDGLNQVKVILRAQLGETATTHWFGSMEFDSLDNGRLVASVAVKFLQNWIQRNYADHLLKACQAIFDDVKVVDVVLRQPKMQAPVSAQPSNDPNPGQNGAAQALYAPAKDRLSVSSSHAVRADSPSPAVNRTHAAGIDGSPLEARYTFDSFIVGAPNRIAHAAATQVAETLGAEQRAFNPVYVHSPVGLGKSHLLQAMAWEIKRRFPNANALYLTAERFRYDFVDALKSKNGMDFKEKFRNLDILIIDDLEFMTGEKTEIEFNHVVNTLLDSGRQLVVAASRPPSQLEGMNERTRSRLSRGLIVEIGQLDDDLRMKVLERRMQEKRALDPSFEVPRAVLQLLAERLVENGRELEGAINSLFAKWMVLRQPLTLETAESVLRDMVQGSGDQHRIKVDDILRVISRHFGVSKQDILSERRHRSIVWPRQIGMFLAKQMTSRSLPEIGRRFGDRDHTTVLHAIRKVDKELTGNAKLGDEIEELKRQLRR